MQIVDKLSSSTEQESATGAVLWNSAIVLGKYFELHARKLKLRGSVPAVLEEILEIFVMSMFIGKMGVELGSGLGLCGILLSLCGVNMTLTGSELYSSHNTFDELRDL